MLVFANVSKKYDARRIIHHFSYCFTKGQIYALVGPSGIGKTTILKMIHKEIQDYSGEIYYDEQNIRKWKNFVFEKISYVSQSDQLFLELTAMENVLLPFSLKGEVKDEIKRKALQLFLYFQVYDCINQKTKNLSGGERQRVAIIQAILKDAPILLLDEPTSALDHQATQQLWNFLSNLKEKKIILLVTHDLRLSKKADVVLSMDKPSIQPMKIKEKKIQEKKIHFCKMHQFQKKVFLHKKIYNYIAVSILSMGLIGLSISFLLQNFIDDAIQQIMKSFHTENGLTMKMPSTMSKIDFSMEELLKDTYYYEGIEKELKKELKENSVIDKIDFNGYPIADSSFIFDNYLCTDNELTFSIPIECVDYKKDQNYIHLSYLNQSLSIKVDKIELNEENQFLLYCNSLSYLYRYFYDCDVKIQKSCYFYSERGDELYDYLCSQKRYAQYYFYQIDSHFIQIIPLSFSRILYEEVIDFYQTYMESIHYYVLSDQENVFIDYTSGFIYCLKYFEQGVQVQIDNQLQEDEYAISKQAYQNLDLESINQEMKLKEIKEENNFAFLYVSADTLNRWCNKDNIAVVLFSFNQKMNIEHPEWLTNQNLFSLSSFKIIASIRYFLFFFSLIIVIFSIVSTFSIFVLNCQSRKKDLHALLQLGVYLPKIFYLFCYDSIKNIIESSSLACMMTIFFQIIMVTIFNQMNHTQMVISFSFLHYACLFVFPLLLLLPFLIIIFVRFLTKK